MVNRYKCNIVLCSMILKIMQFKIDKLTWVLKGLSFIMMKLN